MRLELYSFPVKDIQFGSKTAYRDGLLLIDKEEVLTPVTKDPRITRADLEIVHPGEEVRIVSIREVVEPRVKASGPGCVFPGVLGHPMDTVGQGITNRLSGMALITAAHYESRMRVGTGAPNSCMLDMWGPAAAITPFASTHNVVLVMNLVEDVSENDASDAILKANLTVAQRLAETTLGLAPPQVEVFELTLAEPSLPKVIYIMCCLSGFNRNISLYGYPVMESLPTLVHPNEFFDGAFTLDPRKGKNNYPRMWEWQNQPVVLHLYREHGKRLNFLGVILHRIAADTHMGKEVGARRVAQTAALMGAEAAVVTRTNNSGNRFIDAMLTVQACEQRGIKTVFITPEYGGPGRNELPLVFVVPEADAIASAGSQELRIALSAPKRVIGPVVNGQVLMDLDPVQGRPPQPAGVAITLDGPDNLAGGTDWWGRSRFFCEEH